MSSDRLTDEQIATWALDRWYNAQTQNNEPTVTALLAREVQQWRRFAPLVLHTRLIDAYGDLDPDTLREWQQWQAEQWEAGHE